MKRRDHGIAFRAHAASAQTAEHVFTFLLYAKEVKEIIRSNSAQRWHNRRDQEEGLAELVSYLAGRYADRPDELVAVSRKANEFQGVIISSIRYQMMSETSAFACRYASLRGRGKKAPPIELDDPDCQMEIEREPQEFFEFSGSTHSALDLTEPDLMRHILRCDRAQGRFTDHQREIYEVYLAILRETMKKPSSASVAQRLRIAPRTAMTAINAVNRYLKSYFN